MRKGVFTMKKLITREYASHIQFYKMPKIFFTSPKYMPMRTESKVAYMLIMDLLPLSIQNNWVNKKGEVFVKLSREKLMSLLNIKGTQKVAQVMKELVGLELIVYKKVGLTKCNEIYLYLPEGIEDTNSDNDGPGLDDPKPEDTGMCEKDFDRDVKTISPKALETNHSLCETQTGIKTKFIKNNNTKTYINQSVIQSPKKTFKKKEQETDRRAEQSISEQSLRGNIETVNKMLEAQIHIEDLKEQHDDEFVDEIANNICEMYLNTSTRIGGQDKPRTIIRDVLSKLKMHHIEHVIEQFEKVSAECEIRNGKRYMQTMIYNSIYETNTKIKGHIRYNFGY